MFSLKGLNQNGCPTGPVVFFFFPHATITDYTDYSYISGLQRQYAAQLDWGKHPIYGPMFCLVFSSSSPPNITPQAYLVLPNTHKLLCMLPLHYFSTHFPNVSTMIP